jgi:hypothetical protein
MRVLALTNFLFLSALSSCTTSQDILAPKDLALGGRYSSRAQRIHLETFKDELEEVKETPDPEIAELWEAIHKFKSPPIIPE